MFLLLEKGFCPFDLMEFLVLPLSEGPFLLRVLLLELLALPFKALYYFPKYLLDVTAGSSFGPFFFLFHGEQLQQFCLAFNCHSLKLHSFSRS